MAIAILMLNVYIYQILFNTAMHRKACIKNKEGEEVMLSLKSVELSICISWHKQPSDMDLFAGTSLQVYMDGRSGCCSCTWFFASSHQITLTQGYHSSKMRSNILDFFFTSEEHNMLYVNVLQCSSRKFIMYVDVFLYLYCVN